MYLWIDDYMISHSKNNYDLFPSQMLKNIFLESYYIHIRNLLFFFSNDKPQDDDIIYLDLLNNSCNSKGLYFNKGEWYELRKLINHASVHLTKKRQTENIHGEIYKEAEKFRPYIREKIHAFMIHLRDNVNPDYVHELDYLHIKTRIEYIRKSLEDNSTSCFNEEHLQPIVTLDEIKTTLYEIINGSPVPPGYDIEIWRDDYYPFVANVHYKNQIMFFVSEKQVQDIRDIKDIKLL